MKKTTRRKEEIGIVRSAKMQKTIVVETVRLLTHHKYKKIVRKVKRFKVHDEKNSAKPGDRVKIEETRPISKDKRWRLVQIFKTAK